MVPCTTGSVNLILQSGNNSEKQCIWAGFSGQSGCNSYTIRAELVEQVGPAGA